VKRRPLRYGRIIARVRERQEHIARMAYADIMARIVIAGERPFGDKAVAISDAEHAARWAESRVSRGGTIPGEDSTLRRFVTMIRRWFA
jgi:hypothetical protein